MRHQPHSPENPDQAKEPSRLTNGTPPSDAPIQMTRGRITALASDSATEPLGLGESAPSPVSQKPSSTKPREGSTSDHLPPGYSLKTALPEFDPLNFDEHRRNEEAPKPLRPAPVHERKLTTRRFARKKEPEKVLKVRPALLKLLEFLGIIKK